MSLARKKNAHIPALVLAVTACLAVAALPVSAVQARRENATCSNRP